MRRVNVALIKNANVALILAGATFLWIICYDFYVNSMLPGEISNGTYILDFGLHIRAALQLLDAFKGGYQKIIEFYNMNSMGIILTYPVYHILYIIVYSLITKFTAVKFIELNIIRAGAILNSSLIVVTYLLVNAYWSSKIKKERFRIPIPLLAFLVMFAGPLDASENLGRYYLGGYTGNPWHNPTILVIRPVALVTFWYYVEILEKNKKAHHNYLIAAGLLAFSSICKPSFMLVFMPAMTVYCIGEFVKCRTKECFFQYTRIAISFLPTMVIGIIQELGAISGKKGKGLGIEFLYVWKHFTEHWELSLLVSVAFPLVAYIWMIYLRKWDLKLTLSTIMLIISSLEYMFFYLSSDPFSGDFSWGISISLFICFVTAVLCVLEFIEKGSIFHNKWNIFFLFGIIYLLALHIYYGIVWFMNMNLSVGAILQALNP